MKSFFENKWAWFPLSILGLLSILTICAPLLPLNDPNTTNLSQRLLPLFSHNHLLGTDLLGRDIFSRLIYGMRLSIFVSIVAAFMAAFIGGLIGLVSGYFRSYTDTILMRCIDLLMAFPYMILALAIVAILGPKLLHALFAIAIVNIPFFARTTRGLTIGLTELPFVEAAKLGGQSHCRILFRELIPNVFPTLLITFTTTFGWMLLETAGLSFLGLGAQPPTADLGTMLAEGRKLMLVSPHVALAPGILILIIALCTNTLGDQLRDWLESPEGNAEREHNEPVKVDQPTEFLESQGQLLSLKDLTISFHSNRSHKTVVKNLSFNLSAGECLGIVGESGSGKSITSLAIGGLLPATANIDNGSIAWNEELIFPSNTIEQNKLLGKDITYIFQDPSMSLNPLLKVGDQIVESVREQQKLSVKDAKKQALKWMGKVGIPNPEMRFQFYPHELSGGQRQRISIAMALVNSPKLVIADEPTTALDVTIQHQVITLMKNLIREQNISFIFISHDLAVVSAICDRILVMHEGQIVEQGLSKLILSDPQHPYTKHLLKSIPILGKTNQRLPDSVYSA